MAEQQYNVDVNETSRGLYSDSPYLRQPPGTHRFALNAVNEATDGEQYVLSNELGCRAVAQIPEGYYIIGDRYMTNDDTAVILTNPSNNKTQIGIVNRANKYVPIVDSGTLLTYINHQCDIIFRIRRGLERVIYWVDNYNKARTFNFDRLYNYYSQAYILYLKGGGDPDTYTGEKWDAQSFDLIKSYNSIPFFTNVEVIETGSILPGSYNFAIQYVDSDLNPTEWITTSNTVNIFNDSITQPYYKIRGSRNTQNSIQSFEPANKSIRLTITNLDSSFPYYRVAIITGTNTDGQPTSAFVSDIQSTTDNLFTYAGNNSALTQTSLEDILIENEVLFAPSHIEQIENRLILANTKGAGINWCDYQKFASKISSDLVTREVILNSVNSEPNLKNAKSTFFYKGYMPGAVYAFVIIYVFKDGTLSPGFHIPGRSATYTSSRMKFYELGSTSYQDIHNCSTDNYWGRDNRGDALVGHKVRHHRFPFRSEAGIQLVNRTNDTTTILRYRMTFRVNLTTGSTWPTDGSGNDLVIPYQIKYKVGTSGSPITLTRQLLKSDLGNDIVVYDETDALGDISGLAGSIDIPGVQEEVLNIVSGTLSDYVSGGTPTMEMEGAYSSYDAETVVNTDTSQIFGIEFSNIEKPSDDVIGFYIARAEQTYDDQLVVDNAIIGVMTENTQYKSFGLINPKQYYPAPRVNGNCEVVGFRNSGKTLSYYKKGSWFFNPVYEFFGRKNPFSGILIEGQYSETAIQLPSRLPQYDGCTDFRGVQIQDVQAGTSFNPDVNKGSDSDGFDLIAGYRNIDFTYSTVAYQLPALDSTYYLSAASYQNQAGDVLYNVSCDNKIGIVYYGDNGEVDPNRFYNPTSQKSNLLYGSLTRDNNEAYANFMNRTYYKEHNNPILFEDATVLNDVAIYNGDAFISPFTFTSSVFYDTLVADRKKKSRVWQIVVGAVLVVAGVVASIFTAGASSLAVVAGIGILSAAAISYGVSLAMSGIKFEQFKNMIDNDYSKGLKDTVVDGSVYECIGDDLARADDTFRWFHDRANSLYIESYVPFALRDGITGGVVDFIDSPNQFQEDNFRSYITEKLTTIDRDQGSGRLYKGYATAEFYSMNLDYTRFNKQKDFFHLPIEYDCCADKDENYNTRVWYSEQSFQEERIDNYRVFLPNNYRDIEGEHGEITDLYRLGNALFVHCSEVLWQLPQNLQMATVNEIVSFIGTGEFFNVPPRKVTDDNLGTGGTQHKWATIKTNHGVLFINEIENKIYLHGETLENLTNKGIRNWAKNSLRSFLTQQFYDNLGVPYPLDNNPANPNGIGYISAFDTRHERALITKRDYKYLGDFSKIIIDFDPSKEYEPGTIYIDENGFEEIIDSHFEAPVAVDMNDWIEDPVGNINPSLPMPTSPTNPLYLVYGVAYMDGANLIYKAKNYDEINFNGANQVTDVIPVDLGACTTSTVNINILNRPSKKCPNFFNSGGQTEYQETKIVLGNVAGQVKFLLSTYTIADAFTIYYGEPADNIMIWSTCQLPGANPSCLVSTQPLAGNPNYKTCDTDPLDGGSPYEVAIIFDYVPTNPDVQHVTLVTQAPTPGTAWAYNMGCPCSGGLPVNPDDLTNWDFCKDCANT